MKPETPWKRLKEEESAEKDEKVFEPLDPKNITFVPLEVTVENGEEAKEVVEELTKGCFSPKGRRILAVVATWLAALNAGLALELPKLYHHLMKGEANMPEEDEEFQQWDDVVTYGGMVTGCLSAIYLMNIIGRKGCLLLGTSMSLLGWILIATDGFISSMTMSLTFGRLFTYIQIGLVLAVAQVYITELVHVKTRSFWLVATPIFAAYGGFPVYILSVNGVHWRTAAALCAIPSFISFFILIFMYDSPNWLLHMSRSEAKNAHLYFYGKLPSTEPQQPIQTYRSAHSSYQGFIRPLIVTSFLFFLKHFTGQGLQIFYTIRVFTGVQEHLSMPVFLTILFFVKITLASTGFYFANRFSRRRYLSLTAIGCGICYYIAGTYFLLTGDKREDLESMPVTLAILLYCCNGIFVVGWNLIPYLVIGEIFPIKVRAAGVGLATLFNFACYYTVTKIDYDSVEMRTPIASYYMFATIGVVVATPIYRRLMADTKTMSISELDKMPIPASQTVQAFSVSNRY